MKIFNDNNSSRAAITLTIRKIITLMKKLQWKRLLIIDESSRYRSIFHGLRDEIEREQLCSKQDDPYLTMLLKQLPDVQRQYQSQVKLQEFMRDEAQNEADLSSLYRILVSLINNGFREVYVKNGELYNKWLAAPCLIFSSIVNRTAAHHLLSPDYTNEEIGVIIRKVHARINNLPSPPPHDYAWMAKESSQCPDEDLLARIVDDWPRLEAKMRQRIRKELFGHKDESGQ